MWSCVNVCRDAPQCSNLLWCEAILKLLKVCLSGVSVNVVEQSAEQVSDTAGIIRHCLATCVRKASQILNESFVRFDVGKVHTCAAA